MTPFLTSKALARVVVSAIQFTRSGANLFVDVTLSNIGEVTAQNVAITGATLGNEGSSGLPVFSPNIAPGVTQTLVHALNFNAADFPSGTKTVLGIGGVYSGGTFTVAQRVSVP